MLFLLSTVSTSITKSRIQRENAAKCNQMIAIKFLFCATESSVLVRNTVIPSWGGLGEEVCIVSGAHKPFQDKYKGDLMHFPQCWKTFVPN